MWKLFRAWQGKDFREANGNDLKEWEGTVPLHSHPAALGNTGLALAPLPRPGSSRLQLCPAVLRVTAPSPSITPLPGLIQHMKPLQGPVLQDPFQRHSLQAPGAPLRSQTQSCSQGACSGSGRMTLKKNTQSP